MTSDYRAVERWGLLHPLLCTSFDGRVFDASAFGKGTLRKSYPLLLMQRWTHPAAPSNLISFRQPPLPARETKRYQKQMQEVDPDQPRGHLPNEKEISDGRVSWQSTSIQWSGLLRDFKSRIQSSL